MNRLEAEGRRRHEAGVTFGPLAGTASAGHGGVARKRATGRILALTDSSTPSPTTQEMAPTVPAVPETLLKKRKQTEQTRQEKAAKAVEARKVNFVCPVLPPQAALPSLASFLPLKIVCTSTCVLHVVPKLQRHPSFPAMMTTKQKIA